MRGRRRVRGGVRGGRRCSEGSRGVKGGVRGGEERQ